MPTAIVYSRGEFGISAPLVTVETHLSNGIHRFNIVGLPEKVVKESKDRVRSAIMNANFDFPNRIITVNLAPAELPKEGGRFDLAIAISILAASGQIPADTLEQFEFAGELGLTGQLRPVAGLIPFALATQQADRVMMLPHSCTQEINIVEKLQFHAADNLLQVCELLASPKTTPTYTSTPNIVHTEQLDLADIKGQAQGVRALKIAAAGGHNILLIGPPGTGKTMLAQRLPSILPALSSAQAIELAAIESVSRQHLQKQHWLAPPFCHPHHSASSAALVGGGNPPRPGAISLAHHGVLFLDEFPEFNRSSLESLREPLESGKITLARAGHQREYPANFQLVAAMNPCPCGHYGNPKGQCDCSPGQIQRYRQRISGPLLDRLDLHLQILPINPADLLISSPVQQETSDKVAKLVAQARIKQYQRQACLNKSLNGKKLENYCQLSSENTQYLLKVAETLNLSNRSIHRILKVARTIADLEAEKTIEKTHLAESLSYRSQLTMS